MHSGSLRQETLGYHGFLGRVMQHKKEKLFHYADVKVHKVVFDVSDEQPLVPLSLEELFQGKPD